MSYKNKYLEYKQKYIILKKELYAGGQHNNLNNNVEINRAYIYYNKLNSLYRKYVKDEDLNPDYDESTMDEILLRTIRYSDVEEDVELLTRMGARLFEIPKYSFNDKFLKNITIPESVKYIGKYAFSNNKLTIITIPSSVDTIRNHAFSNNKLVSVSFLSRSDVRIGDHAFEDNSLENITIPSNITNIGYHAFNKNPLKTVKISKEFKGKTAELRRIFGMNYKTISFTYH